MKIAKSLLAVALAAGAAQASAAIYTVTGQTTSVGVIAGPALGEMDLTPELNITGLENALAGGAGNESYWDINLGALSFAGNLDYQSFVLEASPVPGGALDGLFGTTWISYAGDNYTISGGVVSYDAATRTLSLTGASLLGGTPPVATGDETASAAMGAFQNTNIEFSLSLVFSEDLSSFTGTGTGVDVVTDPAMADLINRETLTYSFSGATAVSEVPVPAAAWLFGSALVGLAGAKRRRA